MRKPVIASLVSLGRVGRLALVGLLFCATRLVEARSSADIQSGTATYFTARSCQLEGNSGLWTASGERYIESGMTCALPHRQFGGIYKVTNTGNGRSILVRHNDLGPGRGPRKRGVIVDLTPAAFDQLGGKRGINRRGVAWGEIAVRVERVR